MLILHTGIRDEIVAEEGVSKIKFPSRMSNEFIQHDHIKSKIEKVPRDVRSA